MYILINDSSFPFEYILIDIPFPCQWIDKNIKEDLNVNGNRSFAMRTSLKRIFVNKIKNKKKDFWFTSNEYKTLQSVLNIWYLSI